MCADSRIVQRQAADNSGFAMARNRRLWHGFRDWPRQMTRNAEGTIASQILRLNRPHHPNHAEPVHAQ